MLESSAFSPPASPTNNQTYDFQGKTYSWTGVCWRQVKPAFQLVDPPGIVRLAYGSVNNVASLDFALTSWTSKYRGFLFKLAGIVPVTDGVGLWARFSTDGGSTYDAAAGNYDYAATSGTDAAGAVQLGSGSDTKIDLTGALVGNGTTEGWSGWVELLKPTSTALWSRITHQGYWIDNVATPGARGTFGGGAREAAQDTDGVRFLCSSGNISTGDYAVYGYS